MPPGLSHLPVPYQGVADDLFTLFLLHSLKSPQRLLCLPLRLWLRQHLSVPSRHQLRLRLRLQWPPSLPLTDWGALHLGGPPQPEAAPQDVYSPCSVPPIQSPRPLPPLPTQLHRFLDHSDLTARGVLA